MDFSQFEKVESANPRKGGTFVKEQAYTDIKYRRAEKKTEEKKDEQGNIIEPSKSLGIEGRFFVSNDKFAQLGLDKNALVVFSKGDFPVLAVVSNDDGTILKQSKRGNKTKNFKHVKLEVALSKLGIIDTNLIGKSQYLSLKSEAKDVTIQGIKCFEVFSIAKGSKKETAAKAATEVAQATEAKAPELASAPAPAPAANNTAAEW